jgi:Intracellular proteinase inhibitor
LQRLLINRLMRHGSIVLLVAICVVASRSAGQQVSATPTAQKTSRSTSTRSSDRSNESSNTDSAPPSVLEATPAKRGWFGRVLHPFSSSPAPPQYKDPKLRGLSLALQVSPQTVKLSETRQLAIKVDLSNESKKGIQLEFPNDQRIEIYLRNSAEVVLTKWSDNHAINDTPGVVLINPKEHIEYNETISTRELGPDKVYIAEVFFPRYPDLRARQKFLTAP